jgi:hypothetical protein
VNNPDSPELRLAPNEKPRPRLLDTAASVQAKPADLATPLTRRRPFLVSAFLLLGSAAIAGLLVAGAEYWYRHEIEAKRPPVSVLKPIRQALPTPPRAPLEVPADSLHVSAIVLGSPSLAVVNGKSLSEDEWLEVRTPVGVAALHVIKIEDGLVRFAYGGHTIDARFENAEIQKKSP